MANKYKIIYLPIAQKDLTEILEYVQADNPTAALDLLDQIDQAVSNLELFPFMGQIPKDNRLQHLKYRMLIVGNYLIFYVVIGKTVEIRRILHGKRKYSFLIQL